MNMQEHPFEIVALVGAVVSAITLPLVGVIWKMLNNRIDEIANDGKKSVSRVDHSHDIQTIEKVVERIDDRVGSGFAEMNKRMDSLFALIVKQGDMR
jgi:predicted patatin/cPLA2 family phospholipase